MRVVSRRNTIASRMKGFATFSDSFASNSTLVSKWNNWISGWSLNSSGASSSSTDYALSSVKTSSPNTTITLSNPGSGTGAAFWISDSGNWWAALSSQTQTYSYSYCTSVGSYYYVSSYSCGPGYTWYTNDSPCYGDVFNGTYYYSGIIYYGTYYCHYVQVSYAYSYYTCSADYYSYTTPNYSYGMTSSTGCSTYHHVDNSPCIDIAYYCGSTADVYSYARILKIVKKVNNIFSEVVSTTLDSVTSSLGAIKLIVTGASKGTSNDGTITVQAFSDSNAVNKVGSDLVYNATGAVITNNYGIIASTSNYNQSSTIGEFKIN